MRDGTQFASYRTHDQVAAFASVHHGFFLFTMKLTCRGRITNSAFRNCCAPAVTVSRASHSCEAKGHSNHVLLRVFSGDRHIVLLRFSLRGAHVVACLRIFCATGQSPLIRRMRLSHR